MINENYVPRNVKEGTRKDRGEAGTQVRIRYDLTLS